MIWPRRTILLLLLSLPGLSRPLPAQGVQLQGVPFSATQVITYTTPDGTTQTQGQVARNSSGSTYVEEVDPATGSPIRALIYDVPGKRLITLNLVERRYRIESRPQLQAVPAPTGSVGVQLQRAEQQRRLPLSEVAGAVLSRRIGLGTRQVSGLLTVGTARETRPAGAAVETPVEVDVSWYSVELGLAVMMSERKPQAGSVIEVQLTGVLRSEPQPSLFAIPDGYAPEQSRWEVLRERPASDGV